MFRTLVFLFMTLPLAGNPLDSYRWKNRILVVDGVENYKYLREILTQNEQDLRERNLIVIPLFPTKEEFPLQKKLTPKEVTTLRKEFKTGPHATFILLGKDGGEKARQTKTLNLAKFFALIDTMPMRQAEMRKLGK